MAIHTDDVIGDEGTIVAWLLVNRECDETCNPGNCEVAHNENF